MFWPTDMDFFSHRKWLPEFRLTLTLFKLVSGKKRELGGKTRLLPQGNLNIRLLFEPLLFHGRMYFSKYVVHALPKPIYSKGKITAVLFLIFFRKIGTNMLSAGSFPPSWLDFYTYHRNSFRCLSWLSVMFILLLDYFCRFNVEFINHFTYQLKIK